MNLRENYFLKLIKYLKNVYYIDKRIEHISDGRRNPTYKTAQIISLVLTIFLIEPPLRYIKFAKEQRNGKRSQVLIVTTAMNMSIKTVYRIINARWNIENRVFNNLKNNANLNHCFVHGGNAVEAVLYLMFIASNLFQLFKVRRLKNNIPIQKELVWLLLKGLYLSQRCDVYTLDTG